MRRIPTHGFLPAERSLRQQHTTSSTPSSTSLFNTVETRAWSVENDGWNTFLSSFPVSVTGYDGTAKVVSPAIVGSDHTYGYDGYSIDVDLDPDEGTCADACARIAAPTRDTCESVPGCKFNAGLSVCG